TYLAAFVLAEVVLWLVGRARVRVAGGALEAGGCRLPLAEVLNAEVVADVKPLLRPGVHALVRPWLATGVLVESTTEIWVLSSRRPADLVAALTGPTTPVGSPQARPPV
ncbi:MAG TPA: DUF3093 family protein, partial [Frankiaceae bacterium]|nr:DUF3093 family protein [Frankiaceae bacterium]